MTFRAVSVPDQVAAFLRAGILNSRWVGEMPSESELCRELDVGRNTLRAAIRTLASEGWLAPGGQRRHHQIRRKPQRVRAEKAHIVRVLSPFSLWGIGATNHLLLEQVAARLRSAGPYRLEYEHRPSLYIRHSPRALSRLVSLPDTAGWLLFYATEELQRWFDQSRIPTVLAGKRFEGVTLPSTGPDVAMLARHAAGLLHRRGHQHMSYVRSELTSLSDRLAAEAFVEEARKAGASATVVVHRQEAADLEASVRSLLCANPRPTALVAGAPENALAILVHALNSGLKVPRDLSLISMWDDDYLHYISPTITSYRVEARSFAARLAKALLAVMQGSTVSFRHETVPSHFVPGDTLGEPLPL